MRHGLGGMLLLLACAAGSAEGRPADDPPRASYDALVKQHQDAGNDYFAALKKGETPQERQKARTQARARIEKAQARLVELAEKHPKDAVAVDALVRVVADRLAPGSEPRSKAMQLLARDHVKSGKLGPLCQSLRSGVDGRNETLLRAILAGNPSKSVRAEASLALARYQFNRARLVRLLASDRGLGENFEEFYGKETLEALKKIDPAKLEAEGEKLTRRFIGGHLGEVKPGGLVSLCRELHFSTDRSGEVLLRALLRHDDRGVRGAACLTLAQVLKQRADKGAAGPRGESEKLLARAAREYADVKAPLGGTVGEAAKNELYEIRHLAVGRPAPDVEGEDQDGKKFRLGDYKGRVVLLDFWSRH